MRKTSIRRRRGCTPLPHDAFTRVVTASHLRSPPNLHPHVRRVSFEVRHPSSRPCPPVVVASPARAGLFSRRIELARARRLRRDETSTPRVRRIVSTADDARDRAIDRRRAFARGIPPASSIDLLDSRVLRSESLATRLSSFQSRFRANQRDRATLFCRVPRARAGRPGPGTRAAAASRRGGVLARARPSVGPGSPRARPCSPGSRLDRRVESNCTVRKGRKYPREILGAGANKQTVETGRFRRSVSVSFFSTRARGTDAPLGAARRRRARLTPNRETD